ncbi:hypothetical protein K458DRAFT_418330 [Lentithecium fluviatile CBS 122367]|uniref:Uncharacterized protein n=1 Tax=Lentithecium fluviatile CBS 122367 TaxID=1168545 RepID=A0A6G1J1D7_9PLEO|nr:hypothetical protein K458DRAFT_418330 [Lentithecium fluviatile CBS 122367]
MRWKRYERIGYRDITDWKTGLEVHGLAQQETYFSRRRTGIYPPPSETPFAQWTPLALFVYLASFGVDVDSSK